MPENFDQNLYHSECPRNMAHYLAAVLLTDTLHWISSLHKKRIPYILQNFIEIFFNLCPGLGSPRSSPMD